MWRNWSRSVQFTPRSNVCPRSVGDIKNVIADAQNHERPLRVCGAGHSYNRLVATSDGSAVAGTLLDLNSLNSLDIDDLGKTALVGAGRRIYELGEPLRQKGCALENQGDIDRQVFCGALATGTHGTGLTLKTLSNGIVGFEIVTADGVARWCAEDSTDALSRDLFRFGRIHLGVLGVITKIKIRVLPLYFLSEVRRSMPFELAVGTIRDDGAINVPGELEAMRVANRHCEMWWFPYADKIRLKTLSVPAPAPEGPKVAKFGKWLSDVVAENMGLWCLANMTRLIPPLTKPLARFAQFAAGLSGAAKQTNYSYRVFPRPRLVKVNEMEYAVPIDRGPGCLWALRSLVRDNNLRVFFPIEYRFVAGDNIPLSPFKNRDSAVISVHKFAPTQHEEYFKKAEQIFLGNSGRPHWGKIHYLGPQELSGMHEDWDGFVALREEVDPGGIFLNPYLRNLFGIPI